MYRKKEDVSVRMIEGLQGGTGSVEMTDWLPAEEAEGHGRKFAKIVLKPGVSIGYHIHEHEFEVYYILEGEGLLNDNGNEVVMKAGDFHKCKSGDRHGIVNNGSTDLVMIALIMTA